MNIIKNKHKSGNITTIGDGLPRASFKVEDSRVCTCQLSYEHYYELTKDGMEALYKFLEALRFEPYNQDYCKLMIYDFKDLKKVLIRQACPLDPVKDIML